MTDTAVTPKVTIPLEGRVTGGANIEILRAELRADIRSPLALIRYSDQGRETKYGVCLDLDKKVFIDHLADAQKESVLQRLAPELASLLNYHLQEIRFRQLSYAAQSAAPPASAMGGKAFNVVEEELAAGKRKEQRDGVRVYSHTMEAPVEASVNLREEHITVERHASNRSASGANSRGFNEGAIEVTTTEEAPIVAKEARIVEEVVVGKAATERTETVHDTVRRTDVEVEQIAGQATTMGTTGITANGVSSANTRD